MLSAEGLSKAVSFPNYTVFNYFGDSAGQCHQLQISSSAYPPHPSLETKAILFSESLSLKKGSGVCAAGWGVWERLGCGGEV